MYIIIRNRGYSNVQLDTKCLVEKPICAVETYILCSRTFEEICEVVYKNVA